MGKTGKVNLLWDITAVIQILFIVVLSVIFITDPNGFAMDTVIKKGIPCRYEGGEIVYYFPRGKMSGAVSLVLGLSSILFYAAVVISGIAVIISDRRAYRKIIRLVLDILNGFVFVTLLCMICIVYDDPVREYRPYRDGAEYHEYSDGSSTVVVCEEWFLNDGKAHVYFVDGSSRAYSIGSFTMDDNHGYNVVFADNGVNIEYYSYGKFRDSEFMGFPEEVS